MATEVSPHNGRAYLERASLERGGGGRDISNQSLQEDQFDSKG